MPAPSTACSRCAEAQAARRRQRGAAVLLALLAMSFAAIVATSVIADYGRGYGSLAGRRDQAQARQLARAAVDWARNVLAQDDKESNTDHLSENWAVKIPATPLSDDPADGSVGGEIADLSGRFNLNDLSPGGKPSEAARLRLQRLLENLGEAPDSARAAAVAISAWITPAARGAQDEAPHAPLVAVAELERIPNLPPGLAGRLAPYVTAVPAPSRINVNTAPAEVLSALVSGLSLDRARVLVAERERAWFRDLADFGARLPEGASQPASQLADVRSRYFLVTIQAGYGVAAAHLQALLDRQERWPELLWYRIP
ncbi:type II secretion system minor pseudopilin GspK [Azoarcus sp. TTM-91]|uniref:type II secretion system minor pseudopilin GspK n=1 Tax=Azoarcus sp. TTM-91 TaxID=2691581 RepID=UPI00145E7FCE|nr:type II secretion system minor pseudopilin GspK [Azoarcus sp. TTM-91]NMG35544.1 type II secretion system minor pseudopilin GspK [Azoarcus sp. TTM-91]